eukprot:tig00001029_g6419.t1
MSSEREPLAVLEAIWRVQSLSLDGGYPWSRNPLWGLDSETLPVERMVSAPPADTSAQTNLRSLPATLGPVARAKSVFTCRRRMKKARVQLPSTAPAYPLDTYQDRLHDLEPLPSLTDEVDFGWADASKWNDAGDRGTPITFDDDAPEDLDSIRVSHQAQTSMGQLQSGMQQVVQQTSPQVAVPAGPSQQHVAALNAASSPSLRGTPMAAQHQPPAVYVTAPRDFSCKRAPQLLCPDLYARELGLQPAWRLPKYAATDGLAPPLPGVTYSAVIPHATQQREAQPHAGQVRRRSSAQLRRAGGAAESDSSSSDSEIELGLNASDLPDLAEAPPPAPPPAEAPAVPGASSLDILEGLVTKEGEHVFTRHAFHALATSPYDISRIFFDRPCPAPPPLAPEAPKARDNLVCGEVATALEPPAILVGYQGDWLEADMAAWHIWPEAGLEPVVRRKDITYYVVVPGALAIHDTVKAFFKDLSAVYEAANLGTHVKALKFGYWSVPLPEAPAEGPVDRQALLEAYLQCCSHLGQHIGQLASTNIGGLQRYDGATVVYIISPFSYRSMLSELLKAGSLLLQHASRNPDLHVLTQVVPVEDVMQPLQSAVSLTLELAFSVFNKARRHLVLSSSSKPRPLSPPSDPGTPAVLPATGPRPNCYRHVYEPAFLLAQVPPLPSALGPAPAEEGGPSATEECRALHGCYAAAASGSVLLVVWTDSLGEVLDVHSLIAEPALAPGVPLSRGLMETLWAQACTWMSASRTIQHLVVSRLGAPPPEEVAAWEDFFASLELGGDGGAALFGEALPQPFLDGVGRAPDQLRSAAFLSVHCCPSLLAPAPCSGSCPARHPAPEPGLCVLAEATLEATDAGPCNHIPLRLHVLNEGRAQDVMMRGASSPCQYLQAVARQLHALSYAMLSFHCPASSRLFPLPLHVTSVASMARVIQQLRRE